MDTSDFRKPRADYPIYPSSGIVRPRVKGFRVPKGRRGRKPRGKARYTKPEPPPVPDRFQQAKIQEIKENARDRRERLRLEQDIAREQIRYREAKAVREEQRAAVRLIEGRRVQQRNDRLIADQARHFTDLLDRSERRSGEVQAQYQEFLQQVLSQRNLEYKEPEIKFFKKATGSLFEEEVDIEEVGGLRKAEVVRPSAPVAQSFREAGLAGGLSLEPEPEVPEAVKQSPRFRRRQRRGGVADVPKEEGLGSAAARVLLTAQEQQGALGAESPRAFFEAQIKTPREIAEAGKKLAQEAEEDLETPTPEVPRAQIPPRSAEEIRLSPTLAAIRRQSASGIVETPQQSVQRLALDVFDTSGGGSVTTTPVVRKAAQPEPEPEPTPEPQSPSPQEQDEKAREFLATARDRYGELQEGKTQTLQQIELSDEYLSLTGAKEKPVKFSTIQKQLGDKEIQLKGQPQEFYLKVGEAFDTAGAGKQAGVYKLRNLPAAEGKQKRTTMVLQSVFGTGKTQSAGQIYEDIATLNPYKETKGVNKFKQAEEEGKLKFFVRDVDEV
jgi:hypothetical protein